MPADSLEGTALLAWLDFCVQYKVDFRKTIIQHLRETTGNSFTSCEIQKCFMKVIRHEADDADDFSWTPKHDAQTLAELYQRGTVCLNSISSKQRQLLKHKISEHVKTYAHMLHHDSMHKSGASDGRVTDQKTGPRTESLKDSKATAESSTRVKSNELANGTTEHAQHPKLVHGSDLVTASSPQAY
jgi:hypothetical protein